MQIKSIDKVNGMTCYTVRTFNKLIRYDKVLEVLKNIEDYMDKDGKIDIKLVKEELLEYREYIVKLNDPYSPIGVSCTCKGYYFKKGKCRHIKFVLNKIKNEKNNNQSK